MRCKPWISLAIVVLLAGGVQAADAKKPDEDGFIRNWLILAPIPNGENVSGADALDKQQIADEANIKPKENDTVKVGDQTLTWKTHETSDVKIDFNGILGQETDDSAAYAVTYLVADGDMKDLTLKTGSDDELKVFLNGKEVQKVALARAFDKDQDSAPNLTLNKGVNVLILKVINEKIEWAGAARFVDKDGNPVRNLTVQTAP